MRLHRRRLKLTGEEVAERLDVAISTYQRWENGRQRPHLRTQRKIAEFFQVPPHVLEEWFYDEDECPTCSVRGVGEKSHGRR